MTRGWSHFYLAKTAHPQHHFLLSLNLLGSLFFIRKPEIVLVGTLTFDPVVKHWCFSCLDISTVGNPPFSGVLNQHHLINNISYSERQIESCLTIKRICLFYLLSVVNDTEVNNTLKVFTHELKFQRGEENISKT